MVEHRLVERHGDRLSGLKANGRGALDGILDLRQLDDAHHDLLVRDAQPDPLGEVGFGDEPLQVIGKGGRIDDLAVANDSLGQLAAGDAREPSGLGLHGRHIAAVDVQSHAAAVLVLSE